MEETCTAYIFNACIWYISDRNMFVPWSWTYLRSQMGRWYSQFQRKNLLKMENNTISIIKLCISSLIIFCRIKIKTTQTRCHKKGIRASSLCRVNFTHSTEAGQWAQGRTTTEVLHPKQWLSHLIQFFFVSREFDWNTFCRHFGCQIWQKNQNTRT